MKFPYKIIESKITAQEKFLVAEGYQPTHALIFLKRGRFRLKINGKKEIISSGDCVLFPDHIPFCRKILEPIEFVYIKFASRENCPFSFALPYGKVKIKDKKRFLGSVVAFEERIDQDDDLSVSLREHLLMDILFQFYREQKTFDRTEATAPCRDLLVKATMNYVSENLARKIKIQDICAAIGTNSSTLNFKFRREHGQAIGQYITDQRIKKAEHLLLSSSFSIGEIASRCGFENVYYFSNAFKKNRGISPSAYRNKNQPL